MTRAKAKATRGKQPGGKKAEGKPLKRSLPWFAWLFIALAIAAAVVVVRVYPVGQPSPDNAGKPRAAIVDQLYNLQPNQSFIAEATKELEEYGFAVDLYQGNNVTVDFYRELPTHGHKLIIFRAHSGLLGGISKTVLFTNEEYTPDRYPKEQLFDELLMGAPGRNQPVMFGVTASFVRDSMKEGFDDAAIIMMGCGGIYLEDLAKAFVEKGASVYLAWDLSVLLQYADDATLYLIEQLCSENATVEEAVDRTMHIKGPDPEYEAELQYYPSGTGNRTLESLIQAEFETADDTRVWTG